MLRKNLLIGTLVAGAFVLPSLAAAGVVQGVCSNCHTMHNSQGGAEVGAVGTFANLLNNGNSCVGCHSTADENTATGKPAAAGAAPQVDNSAAAPAGFINNGGYFTATVGIDAPQHNVAGIVAANGDAVLNNTPPGGAALGAQLTCQGCHTQAGHHAAAGAGVYRMLANTVAEPANNTNATAQADYGAKAAAAGVTSGTRAEIIYDAPAMNAFCGSCHTSFHGNANQETGAGSGVWLKHPTDIQVTNGANYPSIVTRLNDADTDAVVIGSSAAVPTAGVAGTDGMLMCLSCHVPHGGPNNDLLAFDYSLELAGGGVSNGCEFCHSYSGAGM